MKRLFAFHTEHFIAFEWSGLQLEAAHFYVIATTEAAQAVGKKFWKKQSFCTVFCCRVFRYIISVCLDNGSYLNRLSGAPDFEEFGSPV